MNRHYFIFAGEASGDLHGSHLIHRLRSLEAHACHFSGVGGPAMRQEGLELILEMEQFQVMGFSDVLWSLPRLYKQFFFVRQAILTGQPDCVILIDYPGFNLRLARSLRQQGYKGKIVHYICPTIWAHGHKRIQTMVQTLDLLLTIYPFEPRYFSHTSLSVKYVGNPLIENIKTYSYDEQWKEKVKIPPSCALIAIFPGSRLGEIHRNLPQQLEAVAQLIKEGASVHVALSCSQDHLMDEIKKITSKYESDLTGALSFVPRQFSYELMRDCHIALAKSGTVTLELALHHCPTVVSYQPSTLNYLMAKYILRLQLPYYCIVNILGNRMIFPELIDRRVKAKRLYHSLSELYQYPEKRQAMKHACESICQQLGTDRANQLAAESIQGLFAC